MIPLLQEFFSILFTIRQGAIASSLDDGYLKHRYAAGLSIFESCNGAQEVEGWATL
jgi:hypothetical protein